MPRNPYHRERSCLTKVKHDTRPGALQHMHYMIRMGASHGMLNVYKCGFCGFWHVGHRTRKPKQRRG